MSVEEQHYFIQLRSADGEAVGGAVNVPASTTTEQLDALLHQLQMASRMTKKHAQTDADDEEPMPHSFFVDEMEILHTLGEDLDVMRSRKSKKARQVSDEGIITVVFQPQAAFRVRAVSRCTSTLSGHEDAILCISFSPDGRRLASGSGDKCVRFWDLNSETPWKVGRGSHDGWVLCLAWSPDNKYLASGCLSGIICLWDASTGELIGQMKGHRGSVTSLAWEPLHLQAPSIRLASSSRDKTVKIWDVRRRTCQTTLGMHTDTVTMVRWGGYDGGSIYTASRDRTIRVWSVDGSLKGSLLGHAHWINSIALSTDYVLRTGAFNEQGSIALTGGNSVSSASIGNIGASDLQAAAQKRYDAAVGNGERVLSASDDWTMFLWDPKSPKKPVARLTGHQGTVNHAAFSPDGRLIASASFDKSVKLWSASSGNFVASLRGHVGRVYQVSWSGDSRLLMSCSQDTTLKVWDVRTHSLKQDLPGHLDEVYAVDWSPTGDRSSSGGKDKTLKLWRQ